jgi:hypothetical protein
MKIDRITIKVSEVASGFSDNDEQGVTAYGGK